MLHTPKYDVRTRAFCGPTAMSAVTGLPISQIRDAIRKASGKETTANGAAHPVMGVSNSDMLAAMRALGWQAVEKETTDNDVNRRDLFRWEDFIVHHSHRGPFIVEVTGHYIAVSKGEVCDTYTKLPIDISRWKRGRRRWVKSWWRFEPIQ